MLKINNEEHKLYWSKENAFHFLILWNLFEESTKQNKTFHLYYKTI